MLKKTLYKIFGTRNERLLKSYYKVVLQINALEAEITKLSDNELQQKTFDFKQRVNKGESLADILPEAFAVCREASRRVLKMRHFDVQLIGGMVLHDGKIAEMRTGEGKTLVGTLATYLNALTGLGVHVVTVNDYLARRDAEEMSKLYNFLGLTVGINLPDMTHGEKKKAYACDITYGTNNEYGFDYLRDNMVFDIRDKVQRTLNFAVVDEVDSILIDEARTPLIISGPAEGSNELYVKLDLIPPLLTAQVDEQSEEGDFWVDEKNNNVVLSEAGHEKVENALVEMGLLSADDNLYNPHNISLMHHLLAAMKAHHVYIKDQHYVVQDGEVVIVDEFTGRLMSGRRWSDGLHQAVEAKEKVKIQRENQTMASITFQNYFRMYQKLSGMTGTADTEAFEFQQIYKLETVVIPTNKQMVRIDHNDKIYMNLDDKYNAIVDDIKDCHSRMQPVLVGTTSVENSEVLSRYLTKAGLKHQVLNAKQHDKEADIIVQAGSLGAITVATNMAGRGTDIILGGNPKPEIASIEKREDCTLEQKQELIDKVWADWKVKNQNVLAAGGLFIIGTERHESRRIDNQLRGRAGRQGDVGASRFYLSLDDPLLRIFGGDRMRGMMQKLGMDKGESIEHKWLSRSIESAQRKVEAHNFDIRKQLLDYDDVSNDQRSVIYTQRDEILTSDDLSDISLGMINGVILHTYDDYIPPKSMEEMWDTKGLTKVLTDEFQLDFNIEDKISNNNKITSEDISDQLVDYALSHYKAKMERFAEKVKLDVDTFIGSCFNDNGIDTQAIDNFCSQNGITTDISFAKFVADNPNITRDGFIEHFHQQIGDMGKRQITRFERGVLLQHLDYYWRDHLTHLEQLRQGIHLRGYAQKDPKQEYKSEAFNLFSNMLDMIKRDSAKVLLGMRIQGLDDIPVEDDMVDEDSIITLHPSFGEEQSADNQSDNPVISRNAPCHCGSGKKYKHCHGKLN